MDHMIKTAGNTYITWKYWHAPYLHAMSMGVIAAYDMYVECCEGLLDVTWKVDKKNRMTFSQFWLQLSKQMLVCMQVTINSGGLHSFIKTEEEIVMIYLQKSSLRQV